MDSLEALKLGEAETKAKAAKVIGEAFGVAADKITFEALSGTDDVAATGIYVSGFKGAQPLEGLLSDAVGMQATPLFTPEGLVKGVVFSGRNVADVTHTLANSDTKKISELAAHIEKAKESGVAKGL